MKRLFVPFLLCAVFLGVLPVTVQAASTQAPSSAKYLVLLVLDAGRPDYITRNLAQMPNMRSLLQHARTYDQAWVGNLLSITPPDHAVIGTGSLPKNDGGIVNWDWGNHKTGKISPTFQSLANYQNGYAFKVIKDSGTPTLAGVLRQKYKKGLVIAGSGAHFHAAGPMGGPDASWIFSYDRIKGYWAPYTLGQHAVPNAILNDQTLQTKLVTNNASTLPLTYDPVTLGMQDTLVIKTGIKALQLYKPRAMLLNLPEVDTAGHWSSNWYPEVARLYRSFDKDLGSLIAAYKKAGIYNKTLFVITADHGMIQSTQRVIDTQAIKDQITSTLGAGSSILVNGGGKGGPTMTPIWLKNPANNQKMAMAIASKHYNNVSAIYYLTNTNGHYAYKMADCQSCSPDLIKTYDYLMSTDAGPTGEDVAILIRENARNSGLSQMPGRHGGADWGSQHITLIMSGPGVANGTSQHPARLADLAPTLERFMGATPKARDGIVLADAFQNPNPTDVATQNASDTTMSVYVNALSTRATHDLLLEKEGKLANSIPTGSSNAQPQRQMAVTIAGGMVLLGTVIGLAWAIAEVRKKGMGLTWME